MPSQAPRADPIDGSDYISKLLKYLSTNKARLSTPPHTSAIGTPVGNIWQQSYTIATLGLDPNSSPLNPTLAQVFSLGLANPASNGNGIGTTVRADIKPLTLRLPPDHLLYLILLFQSSPTSSISSSPNLGETDVPVPKGTVLVAGGSGQASEREGDVKSVKSWVGSLKSVGGVFGSGSGRKKESDSWTTWFGAKRQVMTDDAKLRLIYTALTILPSLTIYPPSTTSSQIKQLRDENAYTAQGGIDVRVPLNVFRSLLSLELDGYDPRGILIPLSPGIRSLTVKDVADSEDWLEDLLTLPVKDASSPTQPRFPSLRHLSLPSTSLFTFPEIPCTTLTHLDLSSNLLNMVPTSLISLTSLESLNLSNNMIESVRGIETILPTIKAINLRSNRLDCLAGLDRLPYLSRIDIRKNELYESDEVSRLAQCPSLKEVWVGIGNPFLEREDEWRVNVFRAFMEERVGKPVIVLDGYEITWGEKRAVQAELSRLGRRIRADVSPRATHTGVVGLPTPAAQIEDPFGGTSRNHAHARGTITPDVPVRSNTPKTRKRQQRIVNLDGTVRLGSDSDEGQQVGSSTLDQLAPIAGPSKPNSHTRSRTTTSPDGGTNQPVKKTRQARVSASVHTPHENVSTAAGTDLTGEELRARMEALKMEVGDSWLRVLAGQQQQSAGQVKGASKEGVLPATEDEETNESSSAKGQTEEGDGDGGVIKVVTKSRKKKKAVGEIN